MKSQKRGGGAGGGFKKGTLYNQYLNKSCYFQNKQGTFLNPKSEETFIQETMLYINLDLFQQTQILVIITSLAKIIPWFNLKELINYQDLGLVILLVVSYLIGYIFRNKKSYHLQRLAIMIVIFFELITIEFMLLYKNLVDIEIWQILGQIGIIIQNTVTITTPLQCFGLTLLQNSIFQAMILCREKEQFDCARKQMPYQSYCNINNLYETTLYEFFYSSSNLMCSYTLLTVTICYMINRIMRRYWIFINSFQKSDKSNSYLSLKNMTTFFIIDQHMQIVFYNEKGQNFIRSCEEVNERITNLSQLFKSKEQQSISAARDKKFQSKGIIIQEKVQEVIQQDKEIELEVWLDESLGKGINLNNQTNQTEESVYEQIETVGLQQTENYQKVYYKLLMGPIMWKNSKMIQIILEKQPKVSEMVQINEYYYDLLFKNSSDNISQLERDYLKWYNMVSLNVIKNDDLKELSKCIYEYHQQYIYLYFIRKLNNEFHKIEQKNLNEFNIKANIIQAVEIILVKKLHLANQIKVQFEGSFPSHEVIADDILFHHMMVSILDLIIQPVEEKHEQKQQIDSLTFKNSPKLGGDGQVPRNAAEPVYKKFDFKIDCKLKQIRRNEIFDLLFIFEFHCLPETERLLQKVFNKVRNIDANDFINPSDLLNQGKDYVNLFLIFLQLKRYDSEFELEKKQYHDIIISDAHRDSNDEHQGDIESNPKCKNDQNIYLLSISLSVQPVSMQTFPGKYCNSNESTISMRLGSTITKTMTQKNNLKNTIRCPAPLNLSFARDPKINLQKNMFLWQYHDEKEAKKTIRKVKNKTTQQLNNKMFPGAQQQSRINKIPTNKEIDSSQLLSLSQSNIPSIHQGSNSQPSINKSQITNQSSGNNLQPIKKESDDMTICINSQISCSQSSSSGIPQIPISNPSSIYHKDHRDSIKKQSDLFNLQKLGAQSPKAVSLNSNIHKQGRRRTSIIGAQLQSKCFTDEIIVSSANKVRSLSRQVSQKIQEENNTSEEEEKKDLFLSDNKQAGNQHQQKISSSYRKIPDNTPLMLNSSKSYSQNNNQSSSKKGQNGQSLVSPLDSKTGNSKQNQNQDRLINPIKAFLLKEDNIQVTEYKSENLILEKKKNIEEDEQQQEEINEKQQQINMVFKQIQETLKLYKHLFIQDTSLVIKQIISHSKLLQGQEINVIQQMKDLRNSPYLFNSSSQTATPITNYGAGGDESDNSQSNTQQRRKINRNNAKMRKNTSILEKLSGVNPQSTSYQLRKSFKMKIIQQQFTDSPQLESQGLHGDSNPPSRVSRELDTILTNTPSQSQMTTSIMNIKMMESSINQTLQKETVEQNFDCIQSADDESRHDNYQIEAIERKRASTYDIPFTYQSYQNSEEIHSYLLPKQINESRAKTHRRQWLTDDVWRKQHYSRSKNILVYTNNSQIVSQLKQISQVSKGFQDCKHVRIIMSLIKEYQQMIESCNIFLFILIDFQEQLDKAENILQQTAAPIRECEERMGVPKTYIIGYVDFKNQAEFLSKNFDKIDFWVNHQESDLSNTITEYVNQIKKKEFD
ncbi:hypothetical protein ABPG72_006267 [Tetrahymena utriculariae]